MESCSKVQKCVHLVIRKISKHSRPVSSTPHSSPHNTISVPIIVQQLTLKSSLHFTMNLLSKPTCIFDPPSLPHNAHSSLHLNTSILPRSPAISSLLPQMPFPTRHLFLPIPLTSENCSQVPPLSYDEVYVWSEAKRPSDMRLIITSTLESSISQVESWKWYDKSSQAH